MQKLTGIFILLFVCFGAGYSLLQYTTNQMSRDPAAVRSGFDFSNLTGEKLHEAAKQRLIAGFEVRKTDLGTGIGLGHFVYVDEHGEKKIACQEFGKVIMTFEADGVAISGEKTAMEVEGHCEYSPDMAKINPLWIPVAKILNEKPGDGEFQFNEGNKITVRFTNLPDQWPKTWILKSVKLENEKNNEALVVDSSEVSKYFGHPLVLNW